MSNISDSVSIFARDARLPEQSGRGITSDGAEAAVLRFDPKIDQTLVLGPQLFSFVQGITEERRKMIAQSALFASLVADAAFVREHVRAWHGAYAGSLQSLGWNLLGTVNHTFQRNEFNSEVHEAIIEFAATIGIGQPALTILTNSLKALKKVGNDQPWITLFDRQVQCESLTGFNVGLVSQDENADLVVKLMSFDVQLEGGQTQVLFVKVQNLKIDLNSVGSTCTIAEDQLKKAQPTLEKRLAAYITDYAAEVPLKART